jgi:hypothetical protein
MTRLASGDTDPGDSPKNEFDSTVAMRLLGLFYDSGERARRIDANCNALLGVVRVMPDETGYNEVLTKGRTKLLKDEEAKLVKQPDAQVLLGVEVSIIPINNSDPYVTCDGTGTDMGTRGDVISGRVTGFSLNHLGVAILLEDGVFAHRDYSHPRNALEGGVPREETFKKASVSSLFKCKNPRSNCPVPTSVPAIEIHPAG